MAVVAPRRPSGRPRTRRAVRTLVLVALVGCGEGGGLPAAPRPEPARVEASGPAQAESPEAESPGRLAVRVEPAPAPSPDGRAAPAPVDRLRAAAADLLADGRAARWARAGRLEPEDLENDYATVSDLGPEVFSVLDAEGYEGFFKCNLLALELAFRAGLRVPVVSRSRGWTYPGPAALGRMIDARTVAGGWALPASGLGPAALEEAAAAGTVFLLVGLPAGRGAGHVGLVEAIHELGRSPAGRIVSVEYTGWEANADGAHHRRRTWPPGRFERIHLVELLSPAPGERQVVAVGPAPDEPSLGDAARLGPGALARAAENPRGGDMRAWPGGLRIAEGEPPSLPVAHGLLGRETVFGPVVDLDRVLAAPGPGSGSEPGSTGR